MSVYMNLFLVVVFLHRFLF